MGGRTRSRFAAVLATAMLAAWAVACINVTVHREGTSKPATAVRASLLGQIQGQWVGHVADNESDVWRMAIEGKRVNVRTSAGEYYKGTLKINDRVSPAQVDVNLTDCSDASLNGEIVPGIVKVEGKKVTFCVSEPGYARPSVFDANEGMLIVSEKR